MDVSPLFTGMVATTVTINEFGEVREVVIHYYPDQNSGYSANRNLFSAKLGKTGRVRYPVQLPLEGLREGKQPRPGWKVVPAANGTVWQYHTTVRIGLRDDVWLVGWGDIIPATNKRPRWVRFDYI